MTTSSSSSDLDKERELVERMFARGFGPGMVARNGKQGTNNAKHKESFVLTPYQRTFREGSSRLAGQAGKEISQEDSGGSATVPPREDEDGGGDTNDGPEEDLSEEELNLSAMLRESVDDRPYAVTK